MAVPGHPSPFPWRCGQPTEHAQHRIKGDGYYGPAGYICHGRPVAASASAIPPETITKWRRLAEALPPRPWLPRVEFVDAARDAVPALLTEQDRLLAVQDVILSEHWQTSYTWGGVLRRACGRCTYGDGVPFLWPCPTRRAITGEPAPDPGPAGVNYRPHPSTTQPEGNKPVPINMDKRIEAAGISLTKMAQRDTTPDLGDDVTAQITLEVDASTSMGSFYRPRGADPAVVQEIIERCLALSMTGLDADKTVPVTFYAGDAWAPIDAHEHDYHDLLARWQKSNSLYPATRYVPAIDYALSVVPEDQERDLPPNLHIFVTDGAPSDAALTERRLIAARTRPHFFQFVVVGRDPSALAYMNRLNNDLTGDGLDNVGVFECPDPSKFSDEEFFDGIVNEFFPAWLPAARNAGYTR